MGISQEDKCIDLKCTLGLRTIPSPDDPLLKALPADESRNAAVAPAHASKPDSMSIVSPELPF
jgi:hypothetical protein